MVLWEKESALNTVHPEYSWVFLKGGPLGTRYQQIPRVCFTVYVFLSGDINI
jgi:hypothetical protein